MFHASVWKLSEIRARGKDTDCLLPKEEDDCKS